MPFTFKSLRPKKNRVPIVVRVAAECWQEAPQADPARTGVVSPGNSRSASRKPRKIEADLGSLEPLSTLA